MLRRARVQIDPSKPRRTFCKCAHYPGILWADGRSERICHVVLTSPNSLLDHAELMGPAGQGCSCPVFGLCNHPDSASHPPGYSQQTHSSHQISHAASRRFYCYRQAKWESVSENYHLGHWYLMWDGQPRCPAQGCPAERHRREAYPQGRLLSVITYGRSSKV